MKKISFNDKFGLTDAVLDGRKTMKRQVINLPGGVCDVYDWTRAEYPIPTFNVRTKDGSLHEIKPNYEIGEVVAIAQQYRTLRWPALPGVDWKAVTEEVTKSRGWTNKLFVKAEYMPHAVRVTDVKVERLQDISDDDAMCEGIYHYDQPPRFHEYDPFAPWPPYVKPYKHDINNLKYRCSARAAFAYLVDMVCGSGTWISNPWVFAYSFELVR